ncbi:MAG: hypothetical protein KME31_02925 [Tolypothrix carrinoi HA7290-LM1]|nr:hypothetical protein [Tolypothrix carrinoi HA7290-LM1]
MINSNFSITQKPSTTLTLCVLCVAPDASSRQSRRQVLQAGKPVQRTASPTHWLLCGSFFHDFA